MKVLLSIVVASAIFAYSACSIPVRANNKSVAAVKLVQKHTYWGETETIVSLHGVRVNNKGRMGYCLVAKEPDWVVTVFRDDDRVNSRLSLQSFQVTGLISNFILSRQDRTFCPISPIREVLDGTELKTVCTPKIKMTYLPLKGIAPAQVESILYALYKVPTNGGIPIRYWKASKGVDWMTGLDTRGAIRHFLSTKKIEHLKVSQKIFDAPTGYRTGESLQEVLLSKASRDASADVDELLK